MRAAAAAGLALGAGAAYAQAPQNPAAEAEDERAPDDTIVVPGQRESDGLSSPLRTQPLLDTTQTVTILEEEFLHQQGIVRLRDAMRNVTGVSIVAGEGNPPSGDAMKIRGFAARDDILLDGMTDVGNYLRDPFFVERMEITQGPASAFAGRGNAGGTINLVTRGPLPYDQHVAELSAGTDNYARATLDYNQVVREKGGVAFRFSAMAHGADEPGRDHVRTDRWGAFAALAFGLETDTQVTLSYLHITQNELPDLGLPNMRDFSMLGSGLEGRVAPVDFSNFYGYSTDYRDIEADVFTARLEHRFANNIQLWSQLRYGRVHNDSIVSAPRIQGQSNSIPFPGGAPAPLLAITPATQTNGLQKPRDEVDEIFSNQTNVTIPFAMSGVEHTFVIGGELSSERALNVRRLDTNGPAQNLFDPALLAADPIPYQGTRAGVTTDTAALYIFDNLEFSPRWEANFGLRYDHVRTHVTSVDDTGTIPGFEQDLARTDNELSGSVSLLFHPIENASLYIGYGTSFETTGRHDIVNIQGRTNAPPTTPERFNAEPERTRSYELGGRLNVGQMEYSAALFHTVRRNARTPGINANDAAAAVDGVHEVNGLTLGANGELLDNWAVFVNYTYLDGEVMDSSNAFEIGQRLDHLPEHSFSLWTTYQLTPILSVGGGGLFVDARLSNVRPNPTFDLTIETPSYWVFDAIATLDLGEHAELRLNINNLTDEVYIQGAQPGQSLPGPRRQTILTLAMEF